MTLEASSSIIFALSSMFGNVMASAPRQVTCLAKTVYFEARGESVQGQMAVANAIRNRVSHKNYPDTFCKVVTQKGQFSFLNGGKKLYELTMKNEKAKEIAFDIAWKTYQLHLTSKPKDNVTTFKTKSAQPNWDYNKMVKSYVVGNHVFYTLK